MDLLGLDYSAPVPNSNSTAQEKAAPGPALPPAGTPSATADGETCEADAKTCEVATTTPTDALPPGFKRFMVRCEGRWRVRSAPTLGSRVIGTVAAGTMVIAQDDVPENTDTPAFPSSTPRSSYLDHINPETAAISRRITALWVRVAKFEAKEPSGISEIKFDAYSSGVMYCLRRNALGYGLYEVGVEPLDGQLITLPEELAFELRADAQRANSDKSEDVSMTWKLLGAAESIGRFFSLQFTGSGQDGVNEELKTQAKRKPEEAFEVRQREQLKKAAGNLKRATQMLIDKGADSGDITSGLPKEVRRPFERLREALISAAAAKMAQVSSRCDSRGESAMDEVNGVPELPNNLALLKDDMKGTPKELQHFVDICIRMERVGAWPELKPDLRQEIINFSNKFCRTIEDHSRTLCKANSNEHQQADPANTSPSVVSNQTEIPKVSGNDTVKAAGPAGDDNLLIDTTPSLPQSTPPSWNGRLSPRSPPGQSMATGLPVLAPPPRPACGLSSGSLIQM